MNIVSTQFTLKHESYEIFLSGCNGSCEGCCNPELKHFDLGVPYQDKICEIFNKIKEFDLLITNIWILGGDPLDQNVDELLDLLLKLKSLNKKIWIWTRYDIDKIPKQILNICDYIKCGEYISDLKCDDNVQYGITLATKNQKIYKLTEDIKQ